MRGGPAAGSGGGRECPGKENPIIPKKEEGGLVLLFLVRGFLLPIYQIGVGDMK